MNLHLFIKFLSTAHNRRHGESLVEQCGADHISGQIENCILNGVWPCKPSITLDAKVRCEGVLHLR